jgi:hypothetical protein
MNGKVRQTAATIIVPLFIALVYFSFWYYTGPTWLPPQPEPSRILGLPRAGVRINALVALRLDEINGLINKYTEPTDPLLCLPYQPMFYFLSGRPNPTRWNYLWPGDQSQKDHEDLIRQSRQASTRMAIILGREELANYAPSIITYLDSDFKRIFEQGKLSVYRSSRY